MENNNNEEKEPKDNQCSPIPTLNDSNQLFNTTDIIAVGRVTCIENAVDLHWISVISGIS